MKTKDNISYDLKEMFRCLNDKESAIDMKAKSKFIKAIDKYVQQHNANNTWRYGSMMFDLRMQDNYRDGRA